jgi:hypothetical protein
LCSAAEVLLRLRIVINASLHKLLRLRLVDFLEPVYDLGVFAQAPSDSGCKVRRSLP